jgi:hypothetical protein
MVSQRDMHQALEMFYNQVNMQRLVSENIDYSELKGLREKILLIKKKH